MIDQKKFVECLQKEGVEFVSGVPDTLLNDFCLYIEANWDKNRHVIAANEGNAVALAAGYYLSTGKVPIVYMQNSGIGNAVNPLVSLAHRDTYGIPMILLIGWRGEPGKKDHAQHAKQGELTPVLLDAMDIPYRVLSDNLEESLKNAKWAIETTKATNNPVALISGKGVLEKGEKENFHNRDTHKLSREEAIQIIVDCMDDKTVFVATTGRASRELYAIREINGTGHMRDFLNVGAMGHASSIATGIALANKNRPVVCLDGDSAAIMHLGAFTTTGKMKADNFFHIVLNNGVHESVGGQESAGYLANLTEIAKNSGYNTIDKAVNSKDEIIKAISQLMSNVGPWFLDIHIRQGIRSDLPPLKFLHTELKEKLMNYLV
ncbi:MAG: phosphonopyruvate decarboxylase [Bacteroidota bacterium]